MNAPLTKPLSWKTKEFQLSGYLHSGNFTKLLATQLSTMLNQFLCKLALKTNTLVYEEQRRVTLNNFHRRLLVVLTVVEKFTFFCFVLFSEKICFLKRKRELLHFALVDKPLRGALGEQKLILIGCVMERGGSGGLKKRVDWDTLSER